MFTSEFALWRSHVSPEGTLEKWLLRDRKAPVAAWAPDKVNECPTTLWISLDLTHIQDKHMKYFKAGGWRAPTCWYKSMMHGELYEQDKGHTLHIAH
jgi:soluble epoxide hydrolase / lipid-phosphate phosphatase